MSNEPENQNPEDLSVESDIFSTPGAGSLGGDAGDGAEDKGPVTFGTTCWGTPCPSANTVSC